MQSHYLFVALDIAAERAAEAERYRLAKRARQPSNDVNRIRRIVARVAVAVARAADETTVDRAATAA